MDSTVWTLEKDLKLLDAILKFGFGNWTDIAKEFPGTVASDCEQRYLQEFIINPKNEELKQIADNMANIRKQPRLCTNNCQVSVDNNNLSSQSILDINNCVDELTKKQEFTTTCRGESSTSVLEVVASQEEDLSSEFPHNASIDRALTIIDSLDSDCPNQDVDEVGFTELQRTQYNEFSTNYNQSEKDESKEEHAAGPSNTELDITIPTRDSYEEVEEEYEYTKTNKTLHFPKAVENFLESYYKTGYNPNRDEYHQEFDNEAEDVLAIINSKKNSVKINDDPEDELLDKQLKLAIVEGYNMRLAERIERKNVIRRHGLYSVQDTYVLKKRLNFRLGSTSALKLLPFLRFMDRTNLDILIRRMRSQHELRTRLELFTKYRKLGIQSYRGIGIHTYLSRKRVLYKRRMGALDMLWSPEEEGEVVARSSAPMRINYLPGSSLLSVNEKELCLTSRITPRKYNFCKQCLIIACDKQNGISLAEAIKLLPLVKQETKKIYDFLLSTGDIRKTRNVCKMK